MTESTRPQTFAGVASPTLHRLILFTDRLARLGPAGQAFAVTVYTALVVWVWGEALDSTTAGFTIASVSLFFTLVDWASLLALPRYRRSFGPIAPGLILFGGLRCLFTISTALLSTRSPLIASTLLLVGHLAITGYVLDSMWGAPFRIGVTRLSYRSPKLDEKPPLRIAHLTDLHVERLTRREEKILDLLDELRPDLIVYTGDLISFSYVEDAMARAECRALMSKLHAPLGVFAVPGTPLVDTETVLESVLGGLENVHLLRDSVLSLPGYPALSIIGLNCTHDPARDGARLAELARDLPPSSYTLLLYHAPDLMPEAAQAGIDLVLCGHTHGGQIRLPAFGAIFTSSIYWKRYEMGEYREGNTAMYVSRGIGMEGKGVPRMRFLCEPEITLIDLQGTRTVEETLRKKQAIRKKLRRPALKPAAFLNPLHERKGPRDIQP